MTSGHRIVVGMDFDEGGDAALCEAIRIASTGEGAELHVVHVVHEGRDTEKLSRELEESMTELRDRLRRASWPAGSVYEIRLHVRFGDIAQTLHQIAVDYDAHLIIVGTHGRSAMARAVLGSVADTLVRTAHLPVLIARTKRFEGLDRSPRLATGAPGPEEHRQQVVSEAIRIGPRVSHISGLV